MIYFTDARIGQISVHYVGNKPAAEPLHLTDKSITLEDEVLRKLMMQYFLQPFEKINERCRFAHPNGDLAFHLMYHFAGNMFDHPESFHESSRQIAKHLFEVSDHPNIKAGELYVVKFSALQMDGAAYEAIGIFKSESKEAYLKAVPEKSTYGLSYEENGINLKKLDKGCIIFNTAKEDGYKIAVIDQTNRAADAHYWIEAFLQLAVLNDDYTQTNHTLTIYKEFVTGKLEESFDLNKTDKIDLLNRSMKYFKEKDQFDLNEFAYEVINNEAGIAAFRDYKQEYEASSGNTIGDSFAIHHAAVKKQARVYKSVLKLDKNFHIYIHGNNELIEKGFDEQMKMNYYKVYFREES